MNISTPPILIPRTHYGWHCVELPIIKCYELVKLCHINRSSPAFWDTLYICHVLCGYVKLNAANLKIIAHFLLIFTVRRVCIARTTPWQDVCTSVRHTLLLSLNGYTYLQSFYTSGSPTILVFPHQERWHYSDSDPPNGGIDYKGVWKSHDFRPISCLSRKWCQIEP